MLDSLPSPEVSYLFKRQLLTHHSYESQIPANQIAIRPDESASRVIGPRIGNTFLIDVEGNNPESLSMSHSRLEPFVKRMSRAGNVPTGFLQNVLNRVVADVHRSYEILCEVARDPHTIEHQSRPQTTALELGINCRQIIMGNAE